MPPCGVWKQTAVPAAKVDEVVAEFELDSPTKIDKVDNHNGTFDVVATFPPCADGSASNQPAN
jgi:hypothetical protein